MYTREPYLGGTMIAGTIKRHIYAGQVLLTPGRGLPAVNQNPFTVAKVDDSRIVFEFPSGPIFVRYSEIDHAIRETRKAGGRVRIGAAQGPIFVRYSEIDHAIRETRKAGGRVRIGAAQGWADSGTLPARRQRQSFANRKLRSPGTRGVWRGGIYDGRQGSVPSIGVKARHPF